MSMLDCAWKGCNRWRGSTSNYFSIKFFQIFNIINICWRLVAWALDIRVNTTIYNPATIGIVLFTLLSPNHTTENAVVQTQLNNSVKKKMSWVVFYARSASPPVTGCCSEKRDKCSRFYPPKKGWQNTVHAIENAGNHMDPETIWRTPGYQYR